MQQCFPEHYRQILSIAYYLILEDKTPLYRFERWGALHQHPYGQNISSQRSSELFASITEEAKQSFFRLQGARRAEQEFWAYDTTSISSYSECLRQVQYGHSKEDPWLPQLNLALVFGEEATDHAPHAPHEKIIEFERALFGVTGLETALGLAITRLHREHKIPLARIVELFTAGPARVVDLRGRGTLARGAQADVTIFDPKKRWTFEAASLTPGRAIRRSMVGNSREKW